jgi:glycosyltransferase involved in cell wall biosynthesis
MRITLVTETFAPQVNGVSRTLGQLVRALRDAGDAVQVVHPDYHDAAAGLDGVEHVPVRSVRPPFYRDLHLPLPPFRRARRAVDAFRPDLVHVATEATLGLALLRHARRREYPVVSSFHTNFDQYAAHYGVGFLNALVWRYLRVFHNRTRETYVPSMATIRDLQSRGFERLVLWPRGVDGALFRPDRPGREGVRAAIGAGPGDVVIGHVSRIAAEKNVAYLAEALRIVAAARPGVRLLIVGDGPARPELEERLGAAAHFAGYRRGDDLADHYAAADLFAFASKTETFGNVVLEAMASGLPVVALRAGGPGDIVRDGETGTLVDPDAPPDRFAAALLTLVDEPARRRAMAAAARAHAETQSWDAIMAALRERYAVVLAGSADPSTPSPLVEEGRGGGDALPG